MRNAVQRAAFVLLSCALLLGAVKWVPEQEAPPVAALPDVYVSGGYAVSTEAAYDQRSLDYAARKLQQLYDSYLTGNDGHIYLSVIPDKGSFVPAIEGYTPASAQETADALLAHGFDLVTGGTDNHLMLADLRKKNITGKELQTKLDEVHITVNKNAIPNDPQKPGVTSGVRIGTPACTTRGFTPEDMPVVADCIDKIATDYEAHREAVLAAVAELVRKHPIYE